MSVHGELWTVKELFVLPNEYVYWSIQIVMYPYMTGLVAGAFVLSSLYHVFGIKQLKEMARFALVFSFALLFVAPLPIVLHLQHPFRGINVFMTPHFTSAIAAFGIVFFTHGAIVASELWFLYRKHFVEVALPLKEKQDKTIGEWLKFFIFCTLTLGVYDISEETLKRDHKAIKVLAGIGIPVACFLHGYAGFIFGSVKANALWMTPLMPVIFIMSAIVSGIAAVIALCKSILTRRGPIAPDRVLAHSDVAPSRKQDPGEKFPWRSLADFAYYLVHLPGHIPQGSNNNCPCRRPRRESCPSSPCRTGASAFSGSS